jgi:hypothetical protein
MQTPLIRLAPPLQTPQAIPTAAATTIATLFPLVPVGTLAPALLDVVVATNPAKELCALLTTVLKPLAPEPSTVTLLAAVSPLVALVVLLPPPGIPPVAVMLAAGPTLVAVPPTSPVTTSVGKADVRLCTPVVSAA